MQPAADSVRAMNRLTERWATTGPVDGGTVLSATSLWPLLALLADVADGPARAELSDAIGLSADEAAAATRGYLEAVASVPGVSTALGLWTKGTLPLHTAWTAGLPAGTHGTFSGDPVADRKRLDSWAEEHTGGLIRSMPVAIDEATELVLAAAQAVRTRWLQPFHETELVPAEGPWQGRYLLGLGRTTSLLDRVGVAHTPDGPLTVLKVLGDAGIDVHLVLGAPDMTPGQVLGRGIRTLSGTDAVIPGDRLPTGEPGPGLRVTDERSRTPEPELVVRTVPFRVEAAHDLLADPARFGLATAMDTSRGHFPGIGPEPLAIGSAAQAGLAMFDAKGFEAATLSVVCAAPGSMPPPPRYTVRRIEAAFDRPFGFLTVHRASRLVLTAGWVADPVPFREPDEDEE
ncbi:serpin family protein [Streptomyces sp. NBC_01304]|uniref:serpin family protein n=1 Tax=Streptomyces sp. NBC_01304 TaxID=2903818 RepID=UPI002E13FCE1|nr:proteinase inhibitor I4 serpin [Streptomyces sp. NBC_01304]